MSLYLADERGHLADVGSASRYAKFLDWAEQQTDAAVQQFADHGSTTQTDALAKALDAAKGSKGSLIQLIADAARVAIGVITVQDSEQETFEPEPRALATKAEIKGFKFDASSKTAVDWAAEHAADLIDGISKTTRDDIKDLVETAMEGNFDVDELAGEISSILGDDARAEKIARTETIRAANKGQQEAWDQAAEAGLLTGKEKQVWIATPDDKTCPICEGLDGTEAAMGEEFEGEEDSYDGPPAHPNCRCTIGLVA